MDFLDAVFGTSTEIEIDRLEDCGTCEGSGVKPGTTASTCSTCGGQGQVMSAMRTPLGVFQQVRVPGLSVRFRVQAGWSPQFSA